MRAAAQQGQSLPSTSYTPSLAPTKPRQFRILYKDADWCAIDKPRCVFVHKPEDGRQIPYEENGLWLLKQQIGGYLYPLHRIDRATSGVVVYALNQEAASHWGAAMRARKMKKSYYAFVRGYTDTIGVVDMKMGGREAVTLYETIQRVQLPMVVGKNKFPFQRYSLIRCVPLTGRYHQIRRHMNYISHPIMNDGDHGDRYHNRAWSDGLQLPGLLLRAASISFPTKDGKTITVSSPASEWGERWERIFEAVGSSPLVSEASVLGSVTREMEERMRRREDEEEPASQGDLIDWTSWRSEMESGSGSEWLHFSEPLPLEGRLPRPPRVDSLSQGEPDDSELVLS